MAMRHVSRLRLLERIESTVNSSIVSYHITDVSARNVLAIILITSVDQISALLAHYIFVL